MKSLLFSAAAVIVITAALSFNQKETPAGSLGDVKYSILPPDQFNQINGSGWVLLDGRKVNGSQLQKHFSISNIPDARGMFLRGLNYDRQDASIDPFFKEHNRVRLVGEQESDALKSHSHQVTSVEKKSHVFIAHSWPSGPGNQPQFEAVAAQKDYAARSESDIFEAAPFGGNETRPKNIAFYIYIKIN